MSAVGGAGTGSGYQDLLKPNKIYKKLNRKDKHENARNRGVRKLGEEKIAEIIHT